MTPSLFHCIELIQIGNDMNFDLKTYIEVRICKTKNTRNEEATTASHH